MRTRTNWIVIHCSATRALQDIGVADIRRWHRSKGWRDVGYHKIIRRDGTVEDGRELDDIGAGVEGHNADSVHICLVGGLDNNTWKPVSNYTAKQWRSLEALVRRLTKMYPDARVLGHRDFKGVQKACPCFDAKPWAHRLGLPT